MTRLYTIALMLVSAALTAGWAYAFFAIDMTPRLVLVVVAAIAGAALGYKLGQR